MIKKYYFIIPLIVLFVAISGSWLTGLGMDWYKTLNLPKIAPPGSLIGMVWSIIFVLGTMAVIFVWPQKINLIRWRQIILLFVINAVLNIAWSWLFFVRHFILGAIVEMILLDLTVIMLIYLIWPIKKIAAVLLIPYAAWVAFATYLTVQILNLN